MNAKKRRELADEARTLCEDITYGYVHDWMQQHPGAQPRWFDTDGFLMQKLLCPPDFDGIQLLTDFSRQLLEFIREDWQRAGGRRMAADLGINGTDSLLTF
jgi:hypothetical protein